MKRLSIFFVLVLCVFGVLAEVEVSNYSIKSSYPVGDILKGEVNLSFSEEIYNQGISSNFGHYVELGEFLDDNGVDFDCFPADCSMGYDYSMGESVKVFDLGDEKKYVGFYLSGGDIEVSNFSFSIDSNFGEGADVPLSIDFFEGEEWSFNWFSESYLGKNWGCYNDEYGFADALIGNSFYCEMISIPDSGSLRVGAKVGGEGVGELTMAVHPESGFGSSWECEFNPNTEEFCEVTPESGEIFSEGDYQVCVGADSLTSYKIFSENTGSTCGFVYGKSVSSSVKDYAIFLQNAKYASSNYFGWDNFDYEAIIERMNYFLEDKYNGNCEEGCVLPISLYGVSQEVRLSNINLVYTDDDEWKSVNVLYDLSPISALVDFDGVWDLELLDFAINRTGEFILYLGDNVLFEENLEVIPAPIVLSVYPLDPPFGVPVKFYANVDFEGNQSLQYYWDFGDGKTEKSSVGIVEHEYNASGNYTLTLKVDAGGDLVNENSFRIFTISPNLAIISALSYKLDSLDKIDEFLAGLPSWYGNKIRVLLELDSVKSDLDRLARLYNASSSDEDLVDIARELFSFNVPSIVGANSVSYPYFLNDLGDVDIEPVEIISGSGSAGSSAYDKAILTWQNNNIDVGYSQDEFFVDYDSGQRGELIRVYDVQISSLASEESYLVIKVPFEQLVFKEDVGARKAGDYTVIILGAGESKHIEFYFEDGEDVVFFVSPRLASLVIDAGIDEDCNYNEVCEEDAGETWVNCRSDCKPVVRAWVYFVLGFFVLAILYSLLQIWYKKRYEKYLFKDSGQLYNLLMYISNARARGQQDLRIEADLKGQGWSSERVNYAMKKSRGERVGMIEIIPITKISAWLRDRKARKQVATQPQQQVGGNINKQVFPRRY